MRKEDVVIRVLIIALTCIAVAAVCIAIEPLLVILAGIIAFASITATVSQYRALRRPNLMSNS